MILQGESEYSERDQKLERYVLSICSELMREIHGELPKVLNLGMRLDRDLGLDSLSRVEFLSRVERVLHVSIPESEYLHLESLADVVRLAKQSSLRVDLLPQEQDIAFAAESNLDKLEAPHLAKTLLEVLEWHSKRSPERVHIELYEDEGRGRKISFAALERESEGVAGRLIELGLQPEQAVILMLPTSEDYFYVFWGVLKAGGIPVPIYPPARRHQLEDHMRRHIGILQNCEAAFLVTIPEGLIFSRLLQSHVPSLQGVWTSQELRQSKGLRHVVGIAGEQTAFLQYTSGSTGQPKGVILSHENILNSVRAMGEKIQADSRDVFLSWLPLYHDMGLIGAWLGCLYFGARLVVMSPLQFLARPERWLWGIHRYRATLTAAPNFAFEICTRKIQDQDIEGLSLSSLRVCFNGAEPVSVQTMENFCRRFAAFGFSPQVMAPVYGLAENTLGLTFPPLGRGPRVDRVDRKVFQNFGEARPAQGPDCLQFVSCGFPLSRHEIRIVDDEDRELASRHEGHLQFRSPASTRGYCRNQKKTEEMFHGSWLDSGDLGYLAEGELYVTGRVKDVIIRSGRKIHPVEIEQEVGRLNGVRGGGVVVFGVFDETSGTERLVVVVETSLRAEGGRTELKSQIQGIVSDCTGAPAEDVVLVPPRSLLKTSSGKIRRSACREAYLLNHFQKVKALWRQWGELLWTAALQQTRHLSKKIAEYSYSAYVWTLLGIAAPFVALILVFVPSPSGCRKALRSLLQALSKLSGLKLSVQGTNNLADLGGRCVFVANHASYLDGFVLLASLDIDFSFVAKVELKRNPFLAFLLGRLQTVYVERFDWEQSVRDADRLIHYARSTPLALLVFPEGTFTRQYGLRPFHGGAFRVAVEAGLPLVPVSIRGTRDILREGSWRIHKGMVNVTIGTPLYAPEQEADLWQRAQWLKQRAREVLHEDTHEPLV